MHLADLTLVTYTYNDAGLAGELLAATTAWTCRPGRILVVDDGSAPAFALPPGSPDADVLRLEPNRGPARAKEAGISAVRTDLILSVDCDIRPHPGWLAACHELIRRPGLGILGGAVEAGPGRDLASRWLQRFRIRAADPDNPLFVGGEIFLLRRAVWEELGGFQGLGRDTHEDYFLSRKALAAGYQLKVRGPAGQETRRLSRSSLAARQAHYGLAPVASVLRREGLAGFLPHLTAAADRLAVILESGDPALTYMELLILAAQTFLLFDQGVRLEEDPDTDRRTFAAALVRLLAPYPRLGGLLRRDLAAMGRFLDEPAAGQPPGVWNALLGLLAPGGDQTVLAWLEQVGAAEIQAEEAGRSFDAHYLDAVRRRP